MNTRYLVTAGEFARRVGVSKGTVRRLRSGARGPSIKVMVTIEAEFGWPVAEQVAALTAGNYPEGFRNNIFGPGVRS